MKSCGTSGETFNGEWKLACSPWLGFWKRFTNRHNLLHQKSSAFALTDLCRFNLVRKCQQFSLPLKVTRNSRILMFQHAFPSILKVYVEDVKLSFARDDHKLWVIHAHRDNRPHGPVVDCSLALSRNPDPCKVSSRLKHLRH